MDQDPWHRPQGGHGRYRCGSRGSDGGDPRRRSITGRRHRAEPRARVPRRSPQGQLAWLGPNSAARDVEIHDQCPQIPLLRALPRGHHRAPLRLTGRGTERRQCDEEHPGLAHHRPEAGPGLNGKALLDIPIPAESAVMGFYWVLIKDRVFHRVNDGLACASPGDAES